VKLQASQSFAWNDGSGAFTITQGNLFAIKAQRGMVVRTNEPHLLAALTVSGDVRVEEDVTKNSEIITCTGSIAGTVKTVTWSGDLTCSCVCNGTTKNWESVLDTQECKNKCIYI
jgi:hypothetical protein